MKCQQCLEQGVVFEVEPCAWSVTLLEPKVYKDETGNHFHDPNLLTTKFICPVGHIWYETEARSCWCGWRPS